MRDQDASPFATGEPFHGLVELFAAEQESCRPRGNVNDPVLINHRIAFGSQSAAQRHVGIEFAGLVEVNDAQPLGPANLSAGRG